MFNSKGVTWYSAILRNFIIPKQGNWVWDSVGLEKLKTLQCWGHMYMNAIRGWKATWLKVKIMIYINKILYLVQEWPHLEKSVGKGKVEHNARGREWEGRTDSLGTQTNHSPWVIVSSKSQNEAWAQYCSFTGQLEPWAS